MNKDDKVFYDKLDDRLDAIDKGQDRILSYIENDEKTGRKGMYEQVSDNTQDIETFKVEKKVWAARLKIISMFFGFIWSALIWGVSLIFKQ